MSEQSVGEMFHKRAEDMVSRVDVVAGMTPTFAEESVFSGGSKFTFDDGGFPVEYTTSKGEVKPLSASSEEMSATDFVGERGSLFKLRKEKYPHPTYPVLSNHFRRFAMPKQIQTTKGTAVSDVVLERGVTEKDAVNYIERFKNDPDLARLQSQTVYPEIILDVAARLTEWFDSLKKNEQAGVKIHTLRDIENDISIKTVTISTNKPVYQSPEKEWETDEMAMRVLVNFKRAGIPIDKPVTVFVVQEFNDMIHQNVYTSSLHRTLASYAGVGGGQVAFVFDAASEHYTKQSEEPMDPNNRRLVIHSDKRLKLLAHELGHAVDPYILYASLAQKEGFATALEYLFNFDTILHKLRRSHFNRSVSESTLQDVFFPDERAGQPINEAYDLSATFLAFVYKHINPESFLPFYANMITTKNIRAALESVVPNQEGSQVIIKEKASKILAEYFKVMNEVES